MRKLKPPLLEQITAQIDHAQRTFYRQGYWDLKYHRENVGPLNVYRVYSIVKKDLRHRSQPMVVLGFSEQSTYKDYRGETEILPAYCYVGFQCLARTRSLASALMLVNDTFQAKYGREAKYGFRGDQAYAAREIVLQSEPVQKIRQLGRELYPEG